MIRAHIDKDGDLRITADNLSRRDLRNCYESDGYFSAEEMVKRDLGRQGYTFTLPEEVGALTDAPIFSDFAGAVWWYPGYMVLDPWGELKNQGRVTFESGTGTMTPAQLKSTRLALGYKSRRHLAEALHMSTRAVDSWEQGVRPVPGWLPVVLKALLEIKGGEKNEQG